MITFLAIVDPNAPITEDLDTSTFFIGVVTLTSLIAILDIVSAPFSALHYNERLKRKQEMSWQISPLIDPMRGKYGFIAAAHFYRDLGNDLSTLV